MVLSLSRSRRRRDRFDPASVPAIAAGYFWDPAVHSALGAAGFTVPELQGKTAKNLVQANTAMQPATGVANGNTYFSFASGRGPIATAAGQIGSTGPLYIGCWIRFPGTTAGSNICVHSGGAGARGFNTYVIAGPTTRFQTSVDGTATAENRFPVLGATFRYAEFIFDGADGVAAHRAQHYVDLVEQTPSVTASHGASVFDSATPTLQWVIAAAGDTVDVGTMFLGVGSIPTLAQRAALRSWKAFA